MPDFSIADWHAACSTRATIIDVAPDHQLEFATGRARRAAPVRVPPKVGLLRPPRGHLGLLHAGTALLIGTGCLPAVAESSSSSLDGAQGLSGAGQSGGEGPDGSGGGAGLDSEAPTAEEGCRVVSCGPENENCCHSTSVHVIGNEVEGYRPRPELVQPIDVNGELTATFSFVEAEQQGYVRFDFNSQINFVGVEFTGHHEGPVEPTLVVTVYERDGVNCGLGFFLLRRSSNNLLGADIDLDAGWRCDEGAIPGRGSQVEFTVFASGPGNATLSISHVEFVPE